MAMSVSAVLEELIHTLGLWEFPCGPGPWKQSAGEDTQYLLDLLDCPASPWHQEPDWSPQAAALRRQAALSLKQLSRSTIYQHFTVLRLMDKGVSVFDGGLLKLSKLEELVLSANQLQEVPAPLLPPSLKVLELRNNCLTSLCSLTSGPPPRLHYLGLASNRLGSHLDICSLTGEHWPELLCLDLSSCDFDQLHVLLGALSSLPCLRSLLLEGNPCSLGSSYPGLTLDALPQLSHLDSEWVRVEEREAFRGLAGLTGLEQGRARVTVHVGQLRGLPGPPHSSDFPLLAFSYHVSYLFLPGSAVDLRNMKGECKSEAAVTGEDTVENVQEKNVQEKNVQEKNVQEKNVQEKNVQEKNVQEKNVQEKNVQEKNVQEKNVQEKNVQEKNVQENNVQEKNVQEPEPHREGPGVCGVCSQAHGSTHSSSRLPWSECMDFSESHHHSVSDLRALKSFLSRGMCVCMEEEKILSWPADSDNNTKETKGAKGKDTPNKSASKDKAKEKKKRPQVELVQDPPIRRVLGSVHVPLHSLLLRGHKVVLCCDFGPQGSEEAPASVLDKDGEKKVKEESGTSRKKTTTAKGKTKPVKEVDGARASGPQEPLTVELCVQLDRWQSAAEASEALSLTH